MTPRTPSLDAPVEPHPSTDSGRPNTVAGAILEAASRHADQVALARHSPTDPRPINFAELSSRVATLAAGLASIGVSRGDHVALIADNDWRWIASDLAILSLGAADVPRASDVTPDEIRYILAHADCKTALVQDSRVLAKVLAVRRNLPDLKTIVQLDMEPGTRSGDTLSFDEVMHRGRLAPAHRPAEFAGSREEIATIVYTSGTTGEPKGVELTHGNILHNIEHLPSVIQIGTSDRFLSILPPWHTFERILEYFALSQGAATIYTNKRQFRSDMRSERATLLGSVPRIWENVLESVDESLATRGRLVSAITSLGLRLSRARRRAVKLLEMPRNADGRAPSAIRRAASRAAAVALAPIQAAMDRTVYRPIREATGGCLRLAISGGGSLPARVDEFFDAAGIVLLNGYGLTETSPVVSVRRVSENVLGTIGRPLPETEVRIMDPEGTRSLAAGECGVVWVRGPQVMRGYHRRPEETARVMSSDRWFNTGDLGYATGDGQLVITGRAKDTIVLLGGENIEPRPIEEKILTCPLIRNVVVVGQDRKQIGALVVPRSDRLAERLGIPAESESAVAAHPAAEEMILREIRRLVCLESGFKSYEQPAAVRLLARDFSAEEGTLTLTFKLRRNEIAVRYRELIEDMLDHSRRR